MAREIWKRYGAVEVQRYADGAIRSWHRIGGADKKKDSRRGSEDGHRHVTHRDRETDRRNLERYWDKREGREHGATTRKITAHDRETDRANGRRARGSHRHGH